MKLELSPSRQKWIALAVLAGLIAVVVLWVAMPAWQAAQLHADRVSMLRRQVSTMQSLVAARPKFQSAIDALAANAEAQTLTIGAEQPALAVAQLQGHVTQIFTQASASVTSAQALAETRDGPLTKVELQITVEADIKALVKALHGLGASRPLIRVERFSAKDPDGDWAVSPQGQPVNKIVADIVISAYMRKP